MSMKTLWAEFKAFAFKGNMIDLAVAVVIGAAFSGVINSLVKDIIMPGVSYAVTAVKTAKDVAGEAAQAAASKAGMASTTPATQAIDATTAAASSQPAAAPAPPPPPATAKDAPDQVVKFDLMVGRFNVGNFIAELLNFVIIAAAVFIVIVKLLGSVMKRVGGTPAPTEPTTKECPECLSVIPLKARRCPNCTSVLTPVTPTASA